MNDPTPTPSPAGSPPIDLQPDTAPTQTVAQLRHQLLQLQQLHDAQVLEPAAYAEARAPLERRLLALVLAGAATDGPAPGTAAPPPAAPPAAAAPAAAPRAGLGTWAAVAAGALLLATAGYGWQAGWLGTSTAVGQAPEGFDAAAQNSGAAGAASAPHALGTDQINQMTEKLAARLQAQPDDAEGWGMLGRSYMALGRHADALSAYEKLRKLRPDDAAAMADYADALAVKNGRKLEGEPLKLIQRALTLAPDNLKALTLAGTAAFNRGDDAQAVQHWDRAVRVGPADNSMVQQARDGAAEARARSKLPDAAASPAAAMVGTAAAPSPTNPAPAPAAAGTAVISGTASLSPEVRQKAQPEDTVFIFARPATGSRMPLAILRKQVKDLPYAFTLDDSLAMSPAARLSGAGQVVVGVRVSKSGQAAPQPGDWEVLSAPVSLGQRDLSLVVSNQLR